MRSFDRPASGRSDLEACRAELRQGSRSFFAASLLLPSRIRRPASALYAFCRLADDAVDVGGGRREAVPRLRERLERAYAGRPDSSPVDRALADVVAQVGMPRALLDAMLEGLEWDAAGRRYDEIGELYAYSARVAGAVGAMMSVLMGTRSPAVIARACDLGVAMQLTNIARDVGEDARAGRLYLPNRWMREAGLEPDAWLAAPRFSQALASVVRRLLGTADALYARGCAAISQLPLGCRPGIHAAGLVYREVGREVERNGFDSVSQRAVVSTQRKVHLIARAFGATLGQPAMVSAPPLDETSFLVDAVVAAPPPPPDRYFVGGRIPPWATFDDRIGWAINLFESLERRDRLAGSVGEVS